VCSPRYRARWHIWHYSTYHRQCCNQITLFLNRFFSSIEFFKLYKRYILQNVTLFKSKHSQFTLCVYKLLYFTNRITLNKNLFRTFFQFSHAFLIVNFFFFLIYSLVFWIIWDNIRSPLYIHIIAQFQYLMLCSPIKC